MTVTVTDQTGRQIRLDKPPMRIISLVPSITETLFALQCGDRVVGRTKFCFEPRGVVEHVPIVGGTKKFHKTRIEHLAPDLIIANKEENDRTAVEDLMSSFAVCVTDVKNLSDALEMMKLLGELTGSTTSAAAMVSEVKEGFGHVNKQPTRSAYLIWRKPLMVCGGDTFINDMMRRSGFNNVFADESRYPSVSMEDLQKAEIDTLLLSSEPYPFSQKHVTEFKEALPDTNVILCDGTYFSWYGSRLIDAPKYFHRLHQEIGLN